MFKFLFTVFLLFILGYYLLKAVFRLFSIFLDNPDTSGRKHHSKEGNVTIEYKEPAKKRFDKDSGEYIDYEEINR